MNNINCVYCEKPIASKKDLLLGTHFISTMTPYHVKCFDEAKKKVGFLRRPVVKIAPSRFNYYIGTNILNIIIGILLLVFSSVFSGISIFKFVRPVWIFLGIFFILLGLMFVIGLLKYRQFK